MHNASQACDAQPGRKTIFYHEASGDRKLRRTLRAEAAGAEVEAAAYATLARLPTRIT